MAAEKLSSEDVTALCTAGEAAWQAAKPGVCSAPFKWRGKSYVAKHSQFRLMIDTPKGELIACKWD